MEDKHVCPICGEPTSQYMGHFRKDGLCRVHGQQYKEGTLIFCEKCKKWHDKNKPCESEEEQTKHELTCLICGEPSNGYHFCKTCWQRYKDGAVDLRITNCTKSEILDSYGNKEFVADNGIEVRSPYELIIMNWLWNNKIRTIYEKECIFTNEENGKTEKRKPDFYCPDYNKLYIECNGMKTKDYLKRKEETMRLYREKGMNVEVLTPEDMRTPSQSLERILEKNGWKP